MLIFYCAEDRVEKEAKSRECFSLRSTRRMLGQAASNIEPMSDEYNAVRCKQLCALERPLGSRRT
jgi:hypothetical protein